MWKIGLFPSLSWPAVGAAVDSQIHFKLLE